MPREDDKARKLKALKRTQAEQSPSPTPKPPEEPQQRQVPPQPPAGQEPTQQNQPTSPSTPPAQPMPEAMQEPKVDNPPPVAPQAIQASVAPSQNGDPPSAVPAAPHQPSSTSEQGPLDMMAVKMLSKLPAAQILLKQVADSQLMEGQSFHLVKLPEDGYASIDTYESLDDLIAAIRDALGQEVSLFPFMGNYMPITKGPNRYLMTPFGNLPLFVIPDAAEVDVETHGYVGPDPTTLDPPEAPKAPVEQPQPEEQVSQPSPEVAQLPPPAVAAAPDADDTPALPEA